MRKFIKTDLERIVRLPFYAKVSLFLVCLISIVIILLAAKNIFIIVFIATFFAIILSPVVNFLERKILSRALALILTILPVLLIGALIGVLLIPSFDRFIDQLPILIKKLQILLSQITSWASDNFNLSTDAIDDWIIKTEKLALSNISAQIGITLASLGSFLIKLILIPVYMFMILYYQPLLIRFILNISGKDNEQRVGDILTEIKRTIQSYLAGLLIEAVIVATLYSSGLLIIGIEYAVVLGIIGALLNVIPYLGGIVAASLFTTIALITKPSSYVIYVLLIYALTHLIDVYFVTPKIVASKVRINALISITVILAGDALWGIPGMLFSIPVTGIFKLIFDRIEFLKPLGELLGDNMPQSMFSRKK